MEHDVVLVLSPQDVTEQGAADLQECWQYFAAEGQPPWLVPRARYWRWPEMGEDAAWVWLHGRGFVLGYLNPEHWAAGAQRLLTTGGRR